MEERMTSKDVEEIRGLFPYEPLFNKVYITLNKLEEDGGITLSDNVLDDKQYIVAGEFDWKDMEVRPGDMVLIDIERLMVPVRQESSNAYETVMQVKIDPVEVEGRLFGLVDDRIIKAKIYKHLL